MIANITKLRRSLRECSQLKEYLIKFAYQSQTTDVDEEMLTNQCQIEQLRKGIKAIIKFKFKSFNFIIFYQVKCTTNKEKKAIWTSYRRHYPRQMIAQRVNFNM